MSPHNDDECRQSSRWRWDPSLYAGSPHYATGRVAYPPELAAALVQELDLDGTGALTAGAWMLLSGQVCALVRVWVALSRNVSYPQLILLMTPGRVNGGSRAGSVVGVDVGITHLAVLSTGEIVANPRHLDAALSRLRVLGRAVARKQGPDRKARRNPSRRWLAACGRLRAAHAWVANQRRDGLHKLTTRLAREHATVVVEDLNVAGMVRNRRLARRIADAGFGELRRQLGYKTGWHGGRLLVADRWYPSSKTCSGCGAVKTKLSLSERMYTCVFCGLVLDRDLNAARNLAALAAWYDTAGSGPVAGRGAIRRTHPGGQEAVKRLPGAAPAGRTGTAAPQGTAAA